MRLLPQRLPVIIVQALGQCEDNGQQGRCTQAGRYHGGEKEVRGGEIIAAQLRAVGIETEISNLEWAQWLEQVFKGKDFGLTIVSHTEPFDIGIYARPDYYFQYDNPDFQALMTELNATTDPAMRTELLAKAQTMISEDYVNGYLFQLAALTVAKAGINGLWANAPTAATDLTGGTWFELSHWERKKCAPLAPSQSYFLNANQ